MKKVFEVDIKCQSCNGTGLYVGMAERDGAAVVCYTCKGTGKYHHKFTYEEFSGRVKCDGVTRVYKTTCGFVHTPEDVEVDGKMIEFSKAGVSYGDWLTGCAPLPVKTLYCPKMWTGQRWDSEACKKHCLVGCSINHCPNRKNMPECWEEYETSENIKQFHSCRLLRWGHYYRNTKGRLASLSECNQPGRQPLK